MKQHATGILLLLFTLTAYSQPKIKLDTFATNINKPVVVTNDRNTSKMYVVSQDGYIIVLDSQGVKLDTFLSITDRVLVSSEQGLLGLTFHPNYVVNGYFYVNYTKKNDGATRISRFKVSANPNRAIADSEFVLLSYTQPFANHNGGDVHFGPDGYLYISSGDGGLGGDPNNNGQNKNSLLGKILRIDVNGASPYSIPPSNPFVGQSNVKEEIWSWGLRNPWRFSFDRQNGNVWIADVGQNVKEELNFQKASSPGGENYGWRCYEADQGYNTAGCGPIGNYVAPIYSYSHNSNGGFAIIGGYVYRGEKYNDLKGLYLFTDYSTGNFWITRNQGDTAFTTTLLPKVFTGISAFGEDKYGEIYLTNVDRKLVYKLRELCSPFTANISTSENPCFPQFNGSASVNISNPNGSTSILWNDGFAGITNRTNLAAGKYIVTVTDAIGCIRKDSVVLVTDTISKPTITQNINVLSTDPGFVYSWFLNGIELPGRTSDTLQVSASGNYQVEIRDGEGCSSLSLPYSYVASKTDALKTDLQKFSVWPNPANDRITIDILSKNSAIRSYSLSTVDGRVIVQKIVGAKQLSDILFVGQLPKGIYLFVVRLENGAEASERLIVQ